MSGDNTSKLLPNRGTASEVGGVICETIFRKRQIERSTVISKKNKTYHKVKMFFYVFGRHLLCKIKLISFGAFKS